MIQLGENGGEVNLNEIHVGEALADGSLTFTDGENPSVTLKLIVRGAVDAYPAYIAVMNYLRTNFWGPNGISSYNIPLDNVQISTTGSLYAYTADCTFQFPSENNNSRNNNGTTPNNPTINDSGYQMPEIQPNDFQYSTVGGSEHITEGYANIQYFQGNSLSAAEVETVSFGTTNHPDSALVPKERIDFGNGIKWNGESFEGVDVVKPSIIFSISVSAPRTWITDSYRQTITKLTGCVNSFPFAGYNSECVLFKGVTASSVVLNYTDPEGNNVKDWYWRLRYEFEAREEIEIEPPDSSAMWYQFSFGVVDKQVEYLEYLISQTSDTDLIAAYEAQIDALQLVAKTPQNSFIKKGFDYVWYKHEKQLTGQSESPVLPVLKQANIVKVYPREDFSLLGLQFPLTVEEE